MSDIFYRTYFCKFNSDFQNRYLLQNRLHHIPDIVPYNSVIPFLPVIYAIPAANNSLSLKECLWLDAVQKHHPITKEAAKHLHEKGLIEGRAPHYTISLKVAKMTKQIGHYTKENGLAENSIQKLLLQLAHNAGSMGFKRQDVYEGLQHVFPSSLTQDEKLRKIGNLLRKIAKEGFITKTISGKQWIITEKGEQELNY